VGRWDSLPSMAFLPSLVRSSGCEAEAYSNEGSM